MRTRRPAAGSQRYVRQPAPARRVAATRPAQATGKPGDERAGAFLVTGLESSDVRAYADVLTQAGRALYRLARAIDAGDASAAWGAMRAVETAHALLEPQNRAFSEQLKAARDRMTRWTEGLE